MSKYTKLQKHLMALDGDAFMTNFDALEDILGFELPPSAKLYPAWWANQGRGQSLAWEQAGWKTSDVSIPLKTVNFIRASKMAQNTSKAAPKLTIAQAKAGLAASFDVLPEAIEITIKC